MQLKKEYFSILSLKSQFQLRHITLKYEIYGLIVEGGYPTHPRFKVFYSASCSSIDFNILSAFFVLFNYKGYGYDFHYK